MTEPICFTEEELAILRELVTAEYRNVPTEIHHSRSLEARDELRQRREVVRSLIEKLRAVPVC